MGFPSRSTILHLRFPFSIFLLPVFLCALLVASSVDQLRAWLVFGILHLLVYPASNGFNSYFDRDTGPIGALASPPPVTKELLVVSLVLDLVALVASFAVSPLFALAVAIYGLWSKLYSWPPVRLKKYPVGGWLATGFGQGGATFLAVIIGIDPAGIAALDMRVAVVAFLLSLLLLGIYPLTQVYQHEEDARRGDITISLRLGIRGSFLLSGFFLLLAVGGFGLFFLYRESLTWALAFILSQAPALVVFSFWAHASFRDGKRANFGGAMRMNIVASLMLNAFFAFHILLGSAGGGRIGP